MTAINKIAQTTQAKGLTLRNESLAIITTSTAINALWVGRENPANRLYRAAATNPIIGGSHLATWCSPLGLPDLPATRTKTRVKPLPKKNPSPATSPICRPDTIIRCTIPSRTKRSHEPAIPLLSPIVSAAIMALPLSDKGAPLIALAIRCLQRLIASRALHQ